MNKAQLEKVREVQDELGGYIHRKGVYKDPEVLPEFLIVEDLDENKDTD